MTGSLLVSWAMLQFLMAYALIIVAPGPIALATGSLASLYGFGKTVPLLVGVATGTASLAGLMAMGAARLGPILPISTVRLLWALVLTWMALKFVRAARRAVMAAAPSQRRPALFATGFLISFLAPGSISFFAVAFMGLMPPVREIGDAVTFAIIIAAFGAGWYALLAAVLSHPAARATAIGRQQTICRASAAALVVMALVTTVSALSAG